MIARVVTKREEARVALIATAVAAVALSGTLLLDLVAPGSYGSPSAATYGIVALLIALGGMGPWMAWGLRGEVRHVTFEPGRVLLGNEESPICASDMTALQTAKGAHGVSVAIARGKTVVFLEVERPDQALRIAQALGVPTMPFGELEVQPVRHWLGVVQGLVASVATACAPLYSAAALQSLAGFQIPGLENGKATFGTAGVVASLIALGLLVTRWLLPGHAVAAGNTTWDRHLALHAKAAAEAARSTAEPIEQAEARAQPALGRVLARGDERVGAWLARLDALPSEGHVYRGDTMMKRDVLWETLGDHESPVESRMAAARVLRLRYGEETSALVRVVDDGDVRVRVHAALGEHEEAEEHLERLGPLFKAG